MCYSGIKLTRAFPLVSCILFASLMSDIEDPNVSVQNAVISGAVNSSMLGILLQGGYKKSLTVGTH